ncbi:MAG: type II toxin-antitoxin system RelE/ParE family toxin, partial [Methylococcales bacterium]|nr:type II toxin-antitoxin system RelE/ParE family toxin [Methylococcales bacterium]
YSLQTWGIEQADYYLGSLVARFEWLAENPQLGKPRDDIKKGYRCFPEGQHLVFYIILNDNIDIIGVVHQSQDITNHLMN